MPKDRDEIHYTATITQDTGGLFDTMTTTVEIPVKRVKTGDEKGSERILRPTIGKK